MRAAFWLLVLTGCPLATGPATGECNADRDCAGNVCARDGFCYPPSQVREVKTTWTIGGMAASTVSCSSSRDLAIGFSGGVGGDEPLMYAPVPCETGQWLMDKLPRSYTIVELGREGGFPDVKAIDATGMVSFDLRF